MTLTIEIHGLEKVEKGLRNLSPELKKAIADGGMDFMKKVKKSAKLMAPKFSGFLASSIFLIRIRMRLSYLQLPNMLRLWKLVRVYHIMFPRKN